MKKTKAFLSLVLVIIIAIGGSGCMRINEKSFVSYLENKYPNDKFTFVAFEGGTLFGGDTLKEGRCYSQNLSEEIYVVYDRSDKTYSDNYLDMKYADKMDETVNTMLKTAFPNEEFCVVTARENFTNTTKSSMLFQNDISFNDYKAKRDFSLYVFMTNYAELSQDEVVKQLETSILNEKIYCDYIDVFILENFTSDIRNNDSLQNDIVVNHKYKEHLSARMIDNSGISSAEWEKN